MLAQALVYEPLVMNTSDGTKPWLAESWDVSDDGTVYTFHLRNDVAFTDGEPFNAEAVKANIDAVQRNRERHAWIVLSNKIVSCDVVDEYTVNLVLSEAYYPTLTELGLTRPYRMMSPKSFIDGETKDGVAYFDQMAADEHLTGIRETSKLLHIPEQLFVKVLLDMKFAYRNSQNKLFPTQRADKSDWARLIEFDKNGYCCSQMKITPLGRLWLFVKLKKQFALPYTISECLAIENIERLKISAE